MSDYQSRGQGGWPSQPPANRGYGQPDYGNGGYGQPDYTPYGPGTAAPPRRRRKRWPIVGLVVVVLILAILGIGDQVAKSVAQNRGAQEIQTSADLSTRPSVNIEGWPFLTQVLAHKVNTIDISANNVTTAGGKLPVDFAAKATGVHLDSSFNPTTADHINGQATISFDSLNSYLANAIGIPGLDAISFSPDPAKGPHAVKADAGVGSVDATVTRTGANEITIKFGSFSGIASLLGDAGPIPDQVIEIPKLPAGVVLGQPAVTGQGVVIPASASNTDLSQ